MRKAWELAGRLYRLASFLNLTLSGVYFDMQEKTKKPTKHAWPHLLSMKQSTLLPSSCFVFTCGGRLPR